MSQATELIARQMAAGSANARVWADILYNVKLYGARGDWNGTTGTDDTAAIQATIDAAIAAGGKAVFFPHGTYKVTALTGLSSVVLFGDNASFVGINNTITQIGTPITSGIVYNIKDFGAVGNGVVDDTASINAAIAAAKAAGGGTVYFPNGIYLITSTLNIGDGTGNAGRSTYHFIRLVGAGRGIETASLPSCTEIKWAGPSGGTVIDFKGLIYGCELSNMRINCAFGASIGINAVALQNSKFDMFDVIDPKPGGIAVKLGTGCGVNMWTNFSLVAQTLGSTGLKLVGTIAADRGDVARQVFISGNIYHSGDAVGSHGIWLEEADNNTFMEILVMPNEAVNNPVGKSIRIDQVAAPDQVFNHENLFINVAAIGGVTGTGGEGGNWFLPYPTSDGSAVPVGDFFHALTYDGKIWNGNKQRYTMRQIQAVNATALVSTTSTTDSLITGMAVTLTTKVSKVKVEFTGNFSKNAGGSGTITLYVNGSAQGQTARSAGADGFSHSLSIISVIDVAAQSNTFEIRYKSSDANAFNAVQREMIVTELY